MIDHRQCIAFAVTGGGNPRFRPANDPFAWGEVIHEFGDVGNIRAPVTLYRNLMSRLVGWVKAERPGHFWFDASTERKKTFYRRLSRHIAEQVDYEHVAHRGRFYFYRRPM